MGDYETNRVFAANLRKFKNEIARNVKKVSKINALRGLQVIFCGEFVWSCPSS